MRNFNRIFSTLIIGGSIFVFGSSLFAGRLQPSDLTYMGAFLLPEDTADFPAVWDWGGQAMTYFPEGDPGAGSGDLYPGSLFATGLDTENLMSEITIPLPAISADVQHLSRSLTLQPFSDVREGLFSVFEELPRVGVEYLPAKEGQASGYLYLTWGQHFHEEPGLTILPTHAWCGTNLDNPETRGPWWVGSESENEAGLIYAVNDYLFSIPESWASAHTGGRSLA